VVRIFLSPDPTLGDGNDVLVAERTVTQPIYAGQGLIGTTPVPAGVVPPGSYYAIEVVDATDAIAESNESNNVRVSSGPVFIDPQPGPLPDLIEDSVSVVTSSSVTYVNDRVYASSSATGVAGWFVVRLYLSPDPTFGDGNDVLVAVRSSSGLFAGDYNYGNTKVPAGIVPPGNYYAIAVADADQQVAETNEGNNVRISTTTAYASQ